MKIKVMIADDQRLMREGLKTLLELEEDLAVVQLAENGSDVLSKIEEAKPDILLMDIRMPIMDGVECTKIVRQQYPSIKVVILTTYDDDEFIMEALKNGAAGYLLKDLSSEKLVGAIKDTYAGNSIMQPEIAARIISYITGAASGSRSETVQSIAAPGIKPEPVGSTTDSGTKSEPAGNTAPEAKPKYAQTTGVSRINHYAELTDREKDVLRLVGKGMTNVEIAKELYISEGTVKNYISNLYSKLEVTDRSKLTLIAIEYT